MVGLPLEGVLESLHSLAESVHPFDISNKADVEHNEDNHAGGEQNVPKHDVELVPSRQVSLQSKVLLVDKPLVLGVVEARQQHLEVQHGDDGVERNGEGSLLGGSEPSLDFLDSLSIVHFSSFKL